MSKLMIDGCIAYITRYKHHRNSRNGFKPIRWRMYVAKNWMRDRLFIEKQIKI
jgi:hypothetical protein